MSYKILWPQDPCVEHAQLLEAIHGLEPGESMTLRLEGGAFEIAADLASVRDAIETQYPVTVRVSIKAADVVVLTKFCGEAARAESRTPRKRGAKRNAGQADLLP